MTVGAARITSIGTQAVPLRAGAVARLPQCVAMVGQGNLATTYSDEPVEITTPRQVLELYGEGSPLHTMALRLVPLDGDGVGIVPVTAYPLQESVGAVNGIGAAFFTVPGVLTEDSVYEVLYGDTTTGRFMVAAGTTNDVLRLIILLRTAVVENNPTQTTSFPGFFIVGSLWRGASTNNITFGIITHEGGTGVTISTFPLAGALNDPDVNDALDRINNRWETMVVSGFSPQENPGMLDDFEAWGAGRWDAQASQPAAVVSGANDPDLSVLQAITATHTTDPTNAMVHVPGSPNTPWAIAARVVARVAAIANEKPACDYGHAELDLLTAGDPATYAEMQDAVTTGVSTTELEDDTVFLSDMVTMYRPEGENPPGFRYLVDIVKLQNVIYSVRSAFKAAAWNGAPLVAEDQAVQNPAARSTRAARCELARVVEQLASEAIIVRPAETIASITAEIAGGKRLDIGFTVRIVSNANIVAVDLNFGFFFGG